VNYAPSKKKAAFMFDYIGPDAIIPRDRVEEVRGHCLLHLGIVQRGDITLLGFGHPWLWLCLYFYFF
jgi:hypothetical protein